MGCWLYWGGGRARPSVQGCLGGWAVCATFQRASLKTAAWNKYFLPPVCCGCGEVSLRRGLARTFSSVCPGDPHACSWEASAAAALLGFGDLDARLQREAEPAGPAWPQCIRQLATGARRAACPQPSPALPASPVQGWNSSEPHSTNQARAQNSCGPRETASPISSSQSLPPALRPFLPPTFSLEAHHPAMGIVGLCILPLSPSSVSNHPHPSQQSLEKGIRSSHCECSDSECCLPLGPGFQGRPGPAGPAW